MINIDDGFIYFKEFSRKGRKHLTHIWIHDMCILYFTTLSGKPYMLVTNTQTQNNNSICHLFLVLRHLVMSNSFVTPWTIDCQASLSMGFSRQEYSSGLPCPPPGYSPGLGIESTSPVSPVAGRFFTHWATWEASFISYYMSNSILSIYRHYLT